MHEEKRGYALKFTVMFHISQGGRVKKFEFLPYVINKWPLSMTIFMPLTKRLINKLAKLIKTS